MKFEEAASRISFDLSYCQADRRFEESRITGPEIDNARVRGGPPQDGNWNVPDWMDHPLDKDGWDELFFEAALAEAVHEVLEWFHVDGVPMIDPHRDVYVEDEVGALAKKLLKRRNPGYNGRRKDARRKDADDRRHTPPG